MNEKKSFGSYSLKMVEHILTADARTKWLERIPFASRIAILIQNGAGPVPIQALQTAWDNWKLLPEEDTASEFKQDTPMMQVVSCAQSIWGDATNIRDGFAGPEALQRIIKQAENLLKITSLSTGDSWKR